MYETKPIEFVYDKKELISESQIDFWSWISKYYFTPIGDVLKAAIPSTFLLESETIIIKKEINSDDIEQMTDDEYLIYEALDFNTLKINEVSDILDKKNTYSVIQKMILKGFIELNFEINEKYKPKLLNVIYLNKELLEEQKIKNALKILNSSPKQKEILMQIISNLKSQKYIILKDFKKIIKFSDSTIKGLEQKGFITINKIKIERNDNKLEHAQPILSSSNSENNQSVDPSISTDIKPNLVRREKSNDEIKWDDVIYQTRRTKNRQST